MIRITFLGAGSTGFSKNVIGDTTLCHMIAKLHFTK